MGLTKKQLWDASRAGYGTALNFHKEYMMEKQERLFHDVRSNFKPVIALQKNKYSLEQEKEKFIQNLCDFIEPLNFEQLQIMGRPKANFKDIIKAFCVMSYHGMSYRRAESDLKKMHSENLIRSIPPRSTLNDYANNENTKFIIERLIQASALFFTENENCMILDSTWFGQRMYTGGYRKVYDKSSGTLNKVRKIHIACLKNSKIIAYAKSSIGTKTDFTHFEECVRGVIKNGFQVKTILADAGYSSKKNYALCKEIGVMNVFIDFKKNATLRRGKSDLWREKLRMYKEQNELWNQTYRFRVIIEGVFSAIKRKNLNWLRSRREIAMDVEVLLKALVYNLTVIGKYS